MSSDIRDRMRRANRVADVEQLRNLFGEELQHRLLDEIRARRTGEPLPTSVPARIDVARRTEDGRDPMSGTTTTKTKTSDRAGQRWRPALIAGVATLLLGAPALLLLGDRLPIWGPSPVTIAEAYLDARNSYDAERARDLIRDAFVTTEAPDGFGRASDIELAFRQHEAWGFHFSEIECFPEASDRQGRDRVRCEYLWTTVLHQVTGHPPTPARMTFMILDGKISAVIATEPSGDFWDPFISFLRDEGHTEFWTLLDRSLLLDPVAVEEVVTELPHYLDLYSEWVESRDG